MLLAEFIKTVTMSQVLCAIVLVIFSLTYANVERIFSDEFINEINSAQSLWKAGKHFDDSMTMEQLRGMLGARRQSKAGMRRRQLPIADVPESFDAREQWPNCTSIQEIADQSECSSCWAVATASAISDRMCIASGGKNQIRISAKNIMSCCGQCGDGCRGGYPYKVWEYWGKTGIPTGGLYNSSLGCQPYPFAPCRHFTGQGDYPDCPALYPTPQCNSHTCDTSEPFELNFGQEDTATLIDNDELQIQLQIQTYGPISAGFDVYADFFVYESGIYKHTTGDFGGRHAVRMIGWGVENRVKYWLLANSYNEGWGEAGYFRMVRGTNDCGIEGECTAGLPL